MNNAYIDTHLQSDTYTHPGHSTDKSSRALNYENLSSKPIQGHSFRVNKTSTNRREVNIVCTMERLLPAIGMWNLQSCLRKRKVPPNTRSNMSMLRYIIRGKQLQTVNIHAHIKLCGLQLTQYDVNGPCTRENEDRLIKSGRFVKRLKFLIVHKLGLFQSSILAPKTLMCELFAKKKTSTTKIKTSKKPTHPFQPIKCPIVSTSDTQAPSPFTALLRLRVDSDA